MVAGTVDALHVGMTSLLRLGCLLSTVVVAAGCASAGDEEHETSANDITASAEPTPACALPYWDWAQHRLEPMLGDPNVSEADLMKEVAAHPPMGETVNTYSACWYPLFAKYFVGDGLAQLGQAYTTFIDRSSPDFRSLAAYEKNVAMNAKTARNAKALLALKPATMTPTDMMTWTSLYGAAQSAIVRPVGLPSLHFYEDVVEDEWVIDAEEAAYLDVIEASRAEPSRDGVYGRWFDGFKTWTFGPALPSSRSFVFNLTWEPGAEGDDYGLAGVQIDQGTPVLPAPVASFLERFEKTAPRAVGADDAAAWMNMYYARGLRAIADLPQGEPLVTKTDLLALDVLERVKPATLEGAHSYETWADLMQLAADQDASWAARFQKVEPCVRAPDLDAANQAHADKVASRPPPHLCRE